MNDDMQKHARITCNILSVLRVVYLLLASVITIFGLMAMKNQVQLDDADFLPALLTGGSFLIPLILFGILHILTGRAFRAGKDWAEFRCGFWQF